MQCQWTVHWLHLDMQNGSPSCSGMPWAQDVIPSICQRSASILQPKGHNFHQLMTLSGTYWYILVHCWNTFRLYMYHYWCFCAALVQDTLLVPPHTYSIKDDHYGVDLEDFWAAQPQLFLSCHLQKNFKIYSHETGPDDFKCNLVFFSTFPSKDPWKMLELKSFMNQTRHPVSSWLLQRIFWANSHWPPAFWMAT